MIARAFPYDRPCRFQKFEATETILATGTTIWKPGLRLKLNKRSKLLRTKHVLHISVLTLLWQFPAFLFKLEMVNFDAISLNNGIIHTVSLTTFSTFFLTKK